MPTRRPGYDVRIDGTDTVIGGTSAVAPLWAGLIARINADQGQLRRLHQSAALCDAFRPERHHEGNNGDFAAAPGWDACTGLGSPDGTKIAALFQQTV